MSDYKAIKFGTCPKCGNFDTWLRFDTLQGVRGVAVYCFSCNFKTHNYVTNCGTNYCLSLTEPLEIEEEEEVEEDVADEYESNHSTVHFVS